MKRFLKILTFFLIISLAIVTIVLKSGIFIVRDFEIQDLKRVKKDDIIKLLQTYEDQNIFMIDTTKRKEEILKNPEIENSIIKRELPDKLIVRIQEKEPIGLIKFMSSYIEVDKNGYVIRIENQIPKDSVIFEGIKVNEATLGQKLLIKDQFLFAEGLIVAKTLKDDNVFERFGVDYVYLILKNVNNIKLKMDKLVVELGNSSDLEYKLCVLKAVYDKLPKHIEGQIIINSNGIATFSPTIEEDK